MANSSLSPSLSLSLSLPVLPEGERLMSVDPDVAYNDTIRNGAVVDIGIKTNDLHEEEYF